MLTRMTASFTVTRRVMATTENKKQMTHLSSLQKTTTTEMAMPTTKTTTPTKTIARQSAKSFDAANAPTAPTSTVAAPQPRQPQSPTMPRAVLVVTMMVTVLLAVLVLLAVVLMPRVEESHSDNCFFSPRVRTRKSTLSRPGQRCRREECRFALVASSHPATRVGSAWSSQSCRIS